MASAALPALGSSHPPPPPLTVAAGAIAGTADGRAEQSTYPMHAVLFVGGTKLSLINRLPAPVHSAEQR